MTATQEVLKLLEKNEKKDLTKDEFYVIMSIVKGRWFKWKKYGVLIVLVSVLKDYLRTKSQSGMKITHSLMKK